MAKTIDKTVYEIIGYAKKYLEKSKDDKCYIQPEEFLLILQKALNDGIGPGYEAVRLNKLQDRMSNYVHEILYKGINFITATPKRIKVDYE
ncbi:MAG: hypothetical protein QXK80_01155 [Candidatus Pacearchaeota archaeon]